MHRENESTEVGNTRVQNHSVNTQSPFERSLKGDQNFLAIIDDFNRINKDKKKDKINLWPNFCSPVIEDLEMEDQASVVKQNTHKAIIAGRSSETIQADNPELQKINTANAALKQMDDDFNESMASPSSK